MVLATGGGAVLLPENRAFLAERGCVVYLKTSVAQQVYRVKHARNRPLLNNVEPGEKLEQLMQVRGPIYEALAHQDGVHLPTAEARTQAGRIRVSQAMRAAPEAPGEPVHATAGSDFPHVHPDQTLGVALERMGSSGLKALPVVSRANVHQLVGTVTLEDILGAFGVVSRNEGDPR